LRHIHIDEVVFKSVLALNPSVSNFTNFVAIKSRPLLRVKLHVEVYNIDAVHEVDKGIAHVALIFEVDWQVKEVVVVLLMRVDEVEQHCLGVLVWNVFNHYCCARIFAETDCFQVDFEV
jgi:hypothetical protein